MELKKSFKKYFRKPKEYQTISLFTILGALTLMTVLLFKVVLFAPHALDTRLDTGRIPAQTPAQTKEKTK